MKTFTLSEGEDTPASRISACGCQSLFREDTPARSPAYPNRAVRRRLQRFVSARVVRRSTRVMAGPKGGPGKHKDAAVSEQHAGEVNSASEEDPDTISVAAQSAGGSITVTDLQAALDRIEALEQQLASAPRVGMTSGMSNGPGMGAQGLQQQQPGPSPTFSGGSGQQPIPMPPPPNQGMSAQSLPQQQPGPSPACPSWSGAIPMQPPPAHQGHSGPMLSPQLPAPPAGNSQPSHSYQGPIYVGREDIPTFRGETPASCPLQRNQEIESWISIIETQTRPPTDEALIRMARGRARGYAQLMLMSPTFDGITSWPEFKARLRLKFRGTCSPERFFDMLAQSRLTPGQSPLDYFQQLEMAIYQAERDYPHDVGDSEGLLRRTFKAGLPGWIQQQLSMLRFPSARALAEAVQQLWDTTVRPKMTMPTATINPYLQPGVQQLSNSATFNPRASFGIQPALQQQQFSPAAFNPQVPYGLPPVLQQLPECSIPLLEYYSDSPRFHTSAVSTPEPPQAQSGPRTPSRSTRGNNQGQKKWCELHRVSSHDTQECFIRNRACFACGERGHFANRCPFRTSRAGPMSQGSPGNGNTVPINTIGEGGETANEDDY